MLDDDTLSGTLRQYDEPDWTPLEDLLGADYLPGWFMWMHEIELDDGAAAHAYKHCATRRYIHLADDGRAFAYLPGGSYLEIPRRRAIDLAFEGWEGLSPGPLDPDAARKAISRARRRAAATLLRSLAADARGLGSAERERRDASPRPPP